MTARTTGSAHRNGQERHAQTVTGTQRTDRDGKGRFSKGNRGGPGNPFNRQVAALSQQLIDALTEERMASVIEAVIQKAEAGDLAAAKLLWQYSLGKPAQPVQPDRLDVEELALYQEQQLAPEDWLRIINSMPADMACQMLRPLMPVLSQSAAKDFQQMAKQSGIEVSKPAPLVTEDNGEQAPSANGDNGEYAPMASGGSGEGAGGARQDPKGAGLACHASVGMAPEPRERRHQRRITVWKRRWKRG